MSVIYHLTAYRMQSAGILSWVSECTVGGNKLAAFPLHAYHRRYSHTNLVHNFWYSDRFSLIRFIYWYYLFTKLRSKMSDIQFSGRIR